MTKILHEHLQFGSSNVCMTGINIEIGWIGVRFHCWRVARCKGGTVCRLVTSCKCPPSDASHWPGLPLNLRLNTFAAKILINPCVVHFQTQLGNLSAGEIEPSLRRRAVVLQSVLYQLQSADTSYSCIWSGLLPRYPTSCSTVGVPIPASRVIPGGHRPPPPPLADFN